MFYNIRIPQHFSKIWHLGDILQLETNFYY